MEPAIVRRLGDELYAALRASQVVEALTVRHPEISVDDAYGVQAHLMERRLADGEKVIGKKIGITSDAVKQMLGVNEPDFGVLTNRMIFPNGAEISLRGAGLMQARAEGEIAFVLGSDLTGTGITREQVLAATQYVVPCFEIVDSRVRDWKIKIQDTIADNASCGVFVLGDAWIDPRSLDLASAKLELYRNGELRGTGLGSAVQGHPAEAVAWLANALGRFGVPFRAGEVILSGALSAMLPVAVGDRFDMNISGIGSASVSFCA